MLPGAPGLSWRKQGLSPGEHCSVVRGVNVYSGSVSTRRASRSPEDTSVLSKVKSRFRSYFCTKELVILRQDSTPL